MGLTEIARCLRCEHLGELLILEAALEKLVLCELAVVILVHLGEYVLGTLLGRVGGPVAGAGAQHVVDSLEWKGASAYSFGLPNPLFVSNRGIFKCYDFVRIRP